MKTQGLKVTALLLIMVIGGMRVEAQQLEAEVPGDNFSLEGALELFKNSASPEAFEKALNSSDSKVNNLDLNGDGYIDYIRVIDRNEGNVHAFIMQAIISDTESQDVAVIELEKFANGKAVLQITGDADVYGIETIIEPTEEVRVNAGTTTSRRVVNVWAWPSVQYVYSPYYTSVWISPWHYSYRPVWYRPWRPIAYYVYRPYWRPYRSYYSVCYTHRVTYAYQIYRPYRTTSVIVHNRHHDRIKSYRSTRHDYDNNGHYKYAKRDTRGGSYAGDSRSDRRQYESRNNTSTNGRQSDSRRTYSDNHSRSTTTSRYQEATRSNNMKRDYSNNTTTTRQREAAPVSRSPQREMNTRSSTPQRNPTVQRSSEQTRKNVAPQTRSNSRSQSTIRTTPTVERRSSVTPSRQSSGNGKSQKSTHSGRSKKGGQ